MKFFITILLTACAISLNAQEYKVAKSSGKILIREVNHVRIEGYDGKEIIFSSRSFDREDDERAKGLRSISSSGLEDNTGFGLSVIEKGDVVEVRQLKKMDGPEVLIKVPKGITIQYEHTSPYGNELKLKNLDNPIEISTVHNQVELENVAGAVKVKTVHGDVDAQFSAVKNIIDIESVHGHVDVSLPADTKADLKVSTAWGEILVDPSLKIEVQKKGEMESFSDKFQGKLNGGGTEIELASTHSNVYLRKK